MAVDLKAIKLIIWDLDNTLWNGILTEGHITDNENNYDFIRKSTDVGIIHSICSKNDITPVEKELKRIGLLEYFVFKSISWDTKGYRVQKIIADMHLRPVNVLFIDDDKRNLEEVQNKIPDIHCEFPSIIPDLQKQLDGTFKQDKLHKRLNQYKLLEKKSADSQKFDKDVDFLRSCNIQIYIGINCLQEADRIFELIQRSNQLNYTKIRPSREDFDILLTNKDFECAYISCKDKYGDYGIVGFYALNKNENRLVHFLFSCRTLGMGIETFVYNFLKKPTLEFVGYVVNDLTDPCPDWIEISDYITDISKNKKHKETGETVNILFKGPCDLLLVEKFFPKNLHISTEFTYLNDRNFSVESFNHTNEIISSFLYSEDMKKANISLLPFMSENYYDTSIFSQKYNVVILSMLCDYSLGCYRNKTRNTSFVYSQFTRNILDENNWSQLINNPVSKIERGLLENLRENYEFTGIISKEKMISNLTFIREHLPNDTLLILLGGAEFNYIEKGSDIRKDRYLVHKEYNAAVKDFCTHYENCEFIDVNPFIKDEKSFMDTISHYVNEVYYEIANAIVKVINSNVGKNTLKYIDERTLIKMKFFWMRKFISQFLPRSFRVMVKKLLKQVIPR